MTQVDYDALAKKFGGHDASPAVAVDYDALAAKYGGKDASPAPAPDPRLELASSGMAGRSGAQVLAPINAQAALSSMAGAGDLMNRAVREAPGVMADYAVGGLKGLGGMADSAIKAIGLPRSQYADAALAPANTVQSVGSGVAQTGAVVGASEAALAAMGLSPIGAFIAKVATSPAGFGAGTAAYDLASGQDLKTAATHGAGASASVLAAKYLPAGISKLAAKMFPKASSAEIAAGVMEAQQALKNPEVQQALKAPEAAVAPAAASVAPDAKAAIAKAQWDYKRQKLLQNGQDIGSWPGFSEPMARPIAPIPPNKLPPVLPDPVVPELAPAPVIVPKSKPAPKVKAEPAKAPEPVSVATSAVSEQTPIAKYYNLHPERSAPEGTVGVHPTLGLPMNAEGKVLVRNVEDFPSETRTPGSQPEGGTVWRDPNRSFFGNPSVQDMADILQARADAAKPRASLSEQMRAIGKGDGVDRMKVPKVSESLATEQARGLQKAQEYVAKTSSDIVTAPKAFEGQQGAKGATQARFKDVAKRTVEGWIKSGKTDKFLMDKLQNMFKMSADDSEALIREVGGKN